MTQKLSNTPTTRPRRRSLVATLALVGALIATGSAMPANASDVGPGPGVISGTATTSDGQPLAGVFVGASISSGEAASFWAYVYTDAAGRYEFTDLAVGYTYGMSASLSGYQNTPWQNVTLTAASSTATANFVVLPFAVGLGTISGYVTGDGVAIAGKGVSAKNYGSSQQLNAVSDAGGFYQFSGLANGEWSVDVSGGAEYQMLNTSIVQLTDSAATLTVNFPLLSWPVGTSSISGVVTDSATGEPLDAQISINGIDVPHSSSVWTDEGAFAKTLLPEGTYSLSFWATGYLHTSGEVRVLADQAVTFDRALVASNSTISGHVQDPDGAPVAGVYIDAHAQVGSGIGGAVTDANGDYLISNVGAIAYNLNVAGSGTPYVAQQRVVTPEANGGVTANFTLVKRTTGNLMGTVLDQNGDWFQQAVCVTLYSAKSKKPLAQTVTWGPDFGDGSWMFVDLKPGKYTVKFRDCDNDPATKFDKVFLGGAKKFKDATFVTIVAGQDSYENSITMTPRKK